MEIKRFCVERDVVENMQKKRILISIGNRKIGDGEPCFIIAEAGVNHNGDINIAKKLIDVAREANADAVKFQIFKAESLVTRDAEKADYQKKNDTVTTTQFEMLKNLELSGEDFIKLSTYAKKKGIVFLSTAFDDESIDLLIRLDIPAFKIPSGEINNFPYMAKIARGKKPIILSTGMSTMEEVKELLPSCRNRVAGILSFFTAPQVIRHRLHLLIYGFWIHSMRFCIFL